LRSRTQVCERVGGAGLRAELDDQENRDVGADSLGRHPGERRTVDAVRIERRQRLAHQRGQPQAKFHVVVHDEAQAFIASLHVCGSRRHRVGHFAARRNATRILVVTAMGVPSLRTGL